MPVSVLCQFLSGTAPADLIPTDHHTGREAGGRATYTRAPSAPLRLRMAAVSILGRVQPLLLHAGLVGCLDSLRKGALSPLPRQQYRKG